MKPLTATPLTYFYMSRPAPCPYLPGRMEQMVFTELSPLRDGEMVHDHLSRAGFRRSQGVAYKPSCRACSACVPVRIRADGFHWGRGWRRIMRQNEGVVGRDLPASALSEHYRLFRRYILSRHGDGGMAAMSFDDYAAMVQDSPVRSRVFEYRAPDGRLYGACLSDILDDGLSLVYSFFDPDIADRSPGSFIILWHVQQAVLRNLPYVYLGYWIAESRKMAYKARFRPVEMLTPRGWADLPD
jgi:arginine-tRNA-protein transferase